MKKSSSYIDPKMYKQILNLLPIATVDIILIYNKKFLLGKRLNHPAKGEWWIPGGRILKGERLIDAVKRKANEETGLKILNINFLTVYETIFSTSAYRVPTHTINSVFTADVKSDKNLSADDQHGQFKWFSQIDKNWADSLRKVLLEAAFKY